MRKIDIKQSLDERVQSAEWTDKDTWNVLDRIRATGKTREKHRLTFLIPAAALAILAICIGITSVVHPGTPDLIRPSIQPLGISSNDGPASPDNGETAEAAQHPDVAAAISSLREEHPEIAEELRPVNLECTKQGIRVEIVSALVKDHSSWILWTMQDLEGDRINETSASFFNQPNNIGVASDYIYCYRACNAEEKRLTVLEEIRYDTMNEPEDGMYLLEADDVYIYEDETVDLKPLLEKYGNAAEGVDPPADAWPYHNGIQGDPVPQALKVLDYNNPADVVLTEKGKLLLTGIGWIDGELHVQIHEADPAFCETHDDGISLIRRNSVAISNCSGDGEPFGYSGDSPYAWNGSGGRWDEWLEFVFGSAPEDEETMTLTAELSYATRTVRDTWEFRIPVSMIRGGGDPEVSGSAVPPVVDEADSMFLSLMYEENPDNLTPVGISHEKDGIRMTVHSVLAEGQEVSVLVFLRDLKDGRINTDTNIQAEFADGTGSGWEYAGCKSTEYDTEKHIYANLIQFRTESVSDPGEHTATLTLGDLSFYERTQMDLAPLVKQYAPADGEGIAEVDIPLHETVTLTGVGWSDGQLFMKFRGTAHEFPIMTCEVFAARGDDKPLDRNSMLRQVALPGDDSFSTNYESTMNISPDETDRMKLTIDFRNPTGTVEDSWEMQFPVTAVAGE